MKFFKIITVNISAETKLKLPNKFVERYGAEVPRSVMLKVPTGAEWRVGVKKDKDGIWLGNGLYKFSESLGIEYGYFLVFDYDVMQAVFHVVVIDISATEIEYSELICIDIEEDKDHAIKYDSKVKEANDEDDIVIVNKVDLTVGCKRSFQANFPLCDSVRKKAKACCNLRNEQEQVEKMNGKRSTESSGHDVIIDDQSTIRRGCFGRETVLDGEGRIRRVVQGRRSDNQISCCARTEKALQRAKNFKAGEPVCIIALSPSYVSQESNGGSKKKCQLVFPLTFLKAYINLQFKELKLRISDGRIWSVKYRLQTCNHVSILTYGWKQFAIDNDLKAGDVCLFELIKGAENALRVVIFRVLDEEEKLLRLK